MVDGQMQADTIENKIIEMIKNELSEIKITNWAALYIDTFGNYWELTYPQSHMHGGGPRQLERLSISDASDWCPTI